MRRKSWSLYIPRPSGHEVSAATVCCHLAGSIVTWGRQVKTLVARAAVDGGANLAEMINEVEARLQNEHCAVSMNSGTTCCMVEVSSAGLVCANVGDSRAILIRNAAPDAPETVSNSWDHNASNVEESMRLGSLGIHPDKYGRYWIRSEGIGWNFTRSLGDFIGKKRLLSAEPDIQETEFEGQFGEGGLLVIASDGLWEFVSPEMIVEATRTQQNVNLVCKHLVLMAKKAWRSNEVSYCDDITVMVVKLHRSRAWTPVVGEDPLFGDLLDDL